jgi:hypothetical protein
MRDAAVSQILPNSPPHLTIKKYPITTIGRNPNINERELKNNANPPDSMVHVIHYCDTIHQYNQEHCPYM